MTPTRPLERKKTEIDGQFSLYFTQLLAAADALNGQSIKNAIFMSKILRLLLPTLSYVLSIYLWQNNEEEKSCLNFFMALRPKNPIIRHYLVQCPNSKRMFTDPEHHQHDDHQ